MSWSTSELWVRLTHGKPGLNPPVIYFTDHSKAVLLLWIFSVFLSCVCYPLVRVCLYVPCGHLLGKGWPLGYRLWCLTVSLLLSHWYLGSGVVLDCIDSWSLHPYLLSCLFVTPIVGVYNCSMFCCTWIYVQFKFKVGLKSLFCQGLSEPEFYGDLVYKFGKIVGSYNFSAQFIKTIFHNNKKCHSNVTNVPKGIGLAQDTYEKKLFVIKEVCSSYENPRI